VAKRRKVSNLLGLHVLAALAEEPLHPYEIATRLRARGKDDDFRLHWGSFYTVVQNLEKHGFVAAAETVRDGRRPERTVYRLTAEGRAEMSDWLHEIVGRPEAEFPRLKAALSVLGVLPPDEAIGLFEQRLALLTEENAASRSMLRVAQADLPRLFLVEAEYSLSLREAEAAWLAGLLRELRDGTISGLDEWRRYHEAGAKPADG
jgi:DNA-binding PadR family transcriptional regulator